MEVKPGYKQTEVGVIPEEWEVARIADVADVKTGPYGSSLHERDYVDDGTPIITVEHLGELGVMHVNLPLVSDPDRKRLRAYLLDAGDIVFSRVGSVDRNALIRKSEAGWLFSGRLLRVRPYKSKAFAPYLSYQFHSEPFKRRVHDVAVGQTMASINTQILNNITTILPILQEQHAIAAALGDVDALIGALDQLIAKKRDLKQAAMQQLLTGQTRLPGFSGEWEVRPLGELCNLETGRRPKGGVTEEGDVPSLGGENVHNDNGLNVATVKKVSESFFLSMSTGVLRERDVLINKDGANTGKVAFYVGAHFEHACVNEHLFIMRGDCALDNGFLYYSLCLPATRSQIDKQIASSAQPGLNRKFVDVVSICVPGRAEQTAIAEVLSYMDAEIAALEQRLAKILSLKQGMMQELLSGRTRLV